ncbi:hypothetical protein, partial [Massilia antarctica]|uniref:hypothetical protein n=1 Tax=Massilia antarctica TaxID=2765360 RepID=UPI0035EDF0E5
MEFSSKITWIIDTSSAIDDALVGIGNWWDRHLQQGDRDSSRRSVFAAARQATWQPGWRGGG